MKKIKLFITLLVIVTGLCSFCYSVFDDKPTQETVKFYVDYQKTVEQNNVLGRYIVYQKEILNSTFKQEKIVGKDTLNGILLSFSGLVSSQDVLFWMQENKMRPATIKEEQAFGIQKEVAFNSSVVALGSVVLLGILKSVPVIINDKRGINLELYPVEGKWNGSFYKFLAIAKTSI